MRDAVVHAITVDLVAGKLGLFQPTGNQDGPTGEVNFYGVLVGLLPGKAKNLLQHFDNIIVAVIVVV